MGFKEKCAKFPYFGSLDSGMPFWLGIFSFIALILGIIVLIFSIVPVLNVLGIVTGVGQIICSICGLIGAKSKNSAMTFITMVGFLIFFVVGMLTLFFFNKSVWTWIFVIMSLPVFLANTVLAFGTRGYTLRI